MTITFEDIQEQLNELTNEVDSMYTSQMVEYAMEEFEKINIVFENLVEEQVYDDADQYIIETLLVAISELRTLLEDTLSQIYEESNGSADDNYSDYDSDIDEFSSGYDDEDEY